MYRPPRSVSWLAAASFKSVESSVRPDLIVAATGPHAGPSLKEIMPLVGVVGQRQRIALRHVVVAAVELDLVENIQLRVVVDVEVHNSIRPDPIARTTWCRGTSMMELVRFNVAWLILPPPLAMVRLPKDRIVESVTSSVPCAPGPLVAMAMPSRTSISTVSTMTVP